MENLVKVTTDGQIAIPPDVRQAVSIQEGDYVAVRFMRDAIVLIPQKIIDQEQAYFWTETWQRGERQADADILAGRVHSFQDVEDLITDLDS